MLPEAIVIQNTELLGNKTPQIFSLKEMIHLTTAVRGWSSMPEEKPERMLDAALVSEKKT